MTEPETGRALSMEQLAALREKSETIGAFLSKRLAANIDVLQPLLSPRRLLGKRVRGGQRDDVVNADPHFSTLRERFAAAAGRPFNTPRELEDDPVSIEGRLVAHAWQYPHTLEDGRSIAMTSPVLQDQKIAMTSPVLRDTVETEDGAAWRTRFVMPAKYTLETLPDAPAEPLDP